jgi:hypothetical protein
VFGDFFDSGFVQGSLLIYLIKVIMTVAHHLVAFMLISQSFFDQTFKAMVSFTIKK